MASCLVTEANQATSLARNLHPSPKPHAPLLDMTKTERQTLESFANSLDIRFTWKAPQGTDCRIVFFRESEVSTEHTFQEFWDAMHYLVVSPVNERDWKKPDCRN